MRSSDLNFGRVIDGGLIKFGDVPFKENKEDFDRETFNGFRCIEPPQDGVHDGEHILFAGCSITWGEGLLKEETWPYLAYQEISKSKKNSGYFNIGFPGLSISQICFWLFKYFDRYGNPDTIFLLLPTPDRFITAFGDADPQLGGALLDEGNTKNINATKLVVRHYSLEIYSMLEAYCLSNGIRLITSTWSSESSEKRDMHLTTTDLLKNTKFFKPLNSLNSGYDIVKFAYEYIDNVNPKTKLFARDNSHPGEPQQAFYAYFMLKQYFGEEYVNPWF